MPSPADPVHDLDPETIAADEHDGTVGPRADREPTKEELQAAERMEREGVLDDSVREHYQQATKTGANVKGEGQIG
jgi:hypothetical protein